MSNDSLFLQQTMGILTNETRLKILGLVLLHACSLEELALSLEIKVSAVARHLRKLQQLGLIERRPAKIGEPVRYKLDTETFFALKSSWYTVQTALQVRDEIALDEGVFEEWERKIIRQFFTGTQLTAIPAGRKPLAVIVKWFAHLFEVGKSYQEKEVNEIIQRHYYDYAFFKKDLVGRGFMRRENGILWRVHPSQESEYSLD
jgi:hypothetical protein